MRGGSLDVHRRRLDDAFAFLVERGLTDLACRFTDRAVFGLLAASFGAPRESLEESADPLCDRKPGEVEEQRQADRDADEEYHAGASESDRGLECRGDCTAEDAAGRARQGRLERVQAERLESGRGDDQQQETDTMRPGRQVVCERIGTHCAPMQATEAASDGNQHRAGDQIGGQAEEQKDDIGHPGADPTACVMQRRCRRRMGKAGIVAAVAEQHSQQGHCAKGTDNPARLGEKPRQSWMWRLDNSRSGPDPGAVGRRPTHAFNACADCHGGDYRS